MSGIRDFEDREEEVMYNTNWTPLIVVFGLVCAFGGWLVIEGLLWLLSHISFTWS